MCAICHLLAQENKDETFGGSNGWTDGLTVVLDIKPPPSLNPYKIGNDVIAKDEVA